MGGEVHIRTAEVADAARIHGLIVALALYEKEPASIVEATPESLAAQLAMDPPPFECLLGELDGRPVGMALYFSNYSTWTGKPGIHLEDLFVDPDARGHGVGRALLQRLAQIAVARGCPRLEWAVLDWNTPAREFYAGLGARTMDGWLTCRLSGEALARLGE